MAHETQPKKETKRPRFVRWALMVGIIVILNIFFVVVRGILFPTPQYSDFCPTNQPNPVDQTSCVAEKGTWIPDGTAQAPVSIDKATKPVIAPAPGGYCDMTTKCQAPFEAAQKSMQAKSFVLLVGLGLLALIVGMLPLGSSIVSTGLSYGGVLAFVIASAAYWNDAPQLIQLGISALALGALLYTGLKHYRD